MGKFPIFQSPELDAAESRMKPCDDFLHGFLGNDKRKLIEILNTDQAKITELGLSHSRIAEKLKELAQSAYKADGMEIPVGENFMVSASIARGKIPCPFGHPGIYPKSSISIRNKKSEKKLCCTDLSIHMIEEHGFYQGKGSPFRIEPEDAAEILELNPL